MSSLRRAALIAGGFLLVPPATFLIAAVTAPERFVSEESIEVKAPPEKVWSVVTDWQTLGAGMNKMMPPVGKRQLVIDGKAASDSAAPIGPGTVLRFPLGDGRSWDQRIVEWQPGKAYVFKNEKGTAAGMPGDVTMAFRLEPVAGGATRVRYSTEVVPDGWVNRAFARIFGEMLGTLKGYEKAILEVVKEKAEKAG